MLNGIAAFYQVLFLTEAFLSGQIIVKEAMSLFCVYVEAILNEVILDNTGRAHPPSRPTFAIDKHQCQSITMTTFVVLNACWCNASSYSILLLSSALFVISVKVPVTPSSLDGY
ncbi:hypothetical protein C8J56DRAFT_1058319 [Mycena floridula]|nr:hypothetical protein C8J56DRAFT_1058319 [Mycena floridula]